MTAEAQFQQKPPPENILLPEPLKKRFQELQGRIAERLTEGREAMIFSTNVEDPHEGNFITLIGGRGWYVGFGREGGKLLGWMELSELVMEYAITVESPLVGRIADAREFMKSIAKMGEIRKSARDNPRPHADNLLKGMEKTLWTLSAT